MSRWTMFEIKPELLNLHWTFELYVQYDKQNLELKEPDCFFTDVQTRME